jgi:hypothetical protein
LLVLHTVSSTFVGIEVPADVSIVVGFSTGIPTVSDVNTVAGHPAIAGDPGVPAVASSLLFLVFLLLLAFLLFPVQRPANPCILILAGVFTYCTVVLQGI